MSFVDGAMKQRVNCLKNKKNYVFLSMICWENNLVNFTENSHKE